MIYEGLESRDPANRLLRGRIEMVDIVIVKEAKIRRRTTVSSSVCYEFFGADLF